jgi:hypothetical protein
LEKKAKCCVERETFYLELEWHNMRKMREATKCNGTLEKMGKPSRGIFYGTIKYNFVQNVMDGAII